MKIDKTINEENDSGSHTSDNVTHHDHHDHA